MRTEVDLSVLVPNYNHARYLPRFLEAVLGQSVLPREIFLIDDASTDDSVRVMESYARREPRIRISRHVSNQGVIRSINQGVKQASGHYLYLGGADDLPLPGLFEKSIALLERYPRAGISCGWPSTFDADSNVVCLRPNGWARKPDYLTPEVLADKVGANGIPGASTLFRRQAFVKAGCYHPDLRWHTDWFAHLVLGFRGGLCYLPEALGLFRITSQGYSASGRRKTAAQLEVVTAVLRRLLAPENADLVRYFASSGVLGFFGVDLLRAATHVPCADQGTLFRLINVLMPWELEPLCDDPDPRVRDLARVLAGPVWRRRVLTHLLSASSLRARGKASVSVSLWQRGAAFKNRVLSWLPGQARTWTRFLRQTEASTHPHLQGKQEPMATTPPLDERSRALRSTIVEMLGKARRGHLGSAFSLIEILRVLYDDVLRYDPRQPKWAGRDRCILSKGHGCLALYSILADKGFFPREELLKFCSADGILGGHPDAGKVPGVEASTGALGHGLNIGIGFALHARLAKSGARVFVILGDGECNEGSVWEGAMCAAKHGLDNLVAMVDYNKHQSYASTREVQDLEPFADKWASFGFAVREVDGHDVEALRKVLQSAPFEPGKPSALICHTIKGKGAPFAENNMAWHHKAKISDKEMDALNRALEVA